MKNIIQISDKKITTRGGLIPILKHIRKCKIPQVIRSCVEKRPFWSTYANEDIFIGLAMNMFCGKKRISQIENIRSKISIIPGLKLGSHDTLGRALKNLATKNTVVETFNKRQQQFIKATINYNEPLSRLLIKSTKRLGLLKQGKSYTLDIDATFISTKCREAERHRKYKKIGFSPMVCMLDNIPVHVSLRNGNAAAALYLKNDIEKCLELLEESNIKVGRVRSDAAGYTKELLEYLDEKNIKFNIRMPLNKCFKNLVSKLKECDEWKRTVIETSDMIWDCDIASFPYVMHDTTMKGRVVCLKVPDLETIKEMESEEDSQRRLNINKKMLELNEKGLLNTEKKTFDNGWVNLDGYNYKIIYTNDFESSNEDLIYEYNKRGGCERCFEYLKQDCGWKYPPFSEMSENNVYLIVSALAYNIFLSALMNFNKYVKGLDSKSRLPKFIDFVVDVSCLIINDNTFEFYPIGEKIDFEKIC